MKHVFLAILISCSGCGESGVLNRGNSKIAKVNREKARGHAPSVINQYQKQFAEAEKVSFEDLGTETADVPAGTELDMREKL